MLVDAVEAVETVGAEEVALCLDEVRRAAAAAIGVEIGECRSERRNLDVVHTICDLVAAETGRPSQSVRDLVTFVTDRPGHDLRYAIDPLKVERECGFSPCETFETGLRKTVRFYLEHEDWVRDVRSGDYRAWIDTHYAGRA